VRNFGAEERRGLAGELEVGDPANPAQRLPLPTFPPIPPGGSATVEVEHVFAAPGEYPLQARIDEDRLARDDRAYAVAVVRSALSVLVVDGDPGADRFSGEAGFLAAALAPRGGPATGIAPEVVRSIPGEDGLKGRDVAIVLNAAEIGPAERTALERFVRAGGGLAFFLGSKVRPDGYREAGGTAPAPGTGDGSAAAAAAGIFPAALKSVVDRPEGTRIDFGEKDHPALAVYRGLRDASVDRIVAARYFDLAPAAGGRTVATYADAGRTPAIVEGAFGAGRTAVFNITADRDWTDWPTDPSFPVVIQEWVRYLAPRRTEARSLQVGETLSWAPEGSEPPAAIDPRGVRRPAVLEAGAARIDRLDVAGIWARPAGAAAATAAKGAEARWFAVNRPIAESDLMPAGEGELRSAFSGQPIRISFGAAGSGEGSEGREGDIWRWLALTAGLLLLGELSLAYWVGRR
jgi:hypothetical protein